MSSFKNTREVIFHTRDFISGKTLDFGAGRAKYRGLIKPCASHYTTFDMVPGENIDTVGDVLNTPFNKDEFDTIVSTQVLEHVEKPWVMVGEMKRILKPGGICIVTAPFIVPYHADPHDYFRYTTEGLASLFRNEGFTIEESGSYSYAPSVLVEAIHFSFFSHYKIRSKNASLWRDRFMRLIKSGAYKMNSLFSGKTVYANSYVVARKPSN